MTPILIQAVIFFTLALIFYSVGVWNERLTRRLKRWHVGFFIVGVITDALGTWLMYVNLGYIKFTPHTISGFIGFFLMVFHCLWAAMALKRNKESQLKSFHKFSLFVWCVWMISYLSGMVLGIQRIS